MNAQTIANTVNEYEQMQLPLFRQAKFNTQASDRAQRWTYLISDNVQFAKRQAYTIRLPRPEQAELMVWIEKIVTSNQCSTLFVEQLSINENRLKNIKSLCKEHRVHLVNLPVQQVSEENVIRGPWQN